MMARSLSKLTANVPQIPEEGDFKIQNFQLTMNLNRSTKSDITTKPPFLLMCCYVSVFFFIFCGWENIKQLNN